jgi:hypothetical protein
MFVYVGLGLLLILVVALFLTREGFDDQAARDSEIPTNADMQIISSKIPNAPQPPNVDMTDAVVYAPVDQAADIQAIKKRLNNMEMNLPGTIADTSYSILSPMVGNLLRQNGYPLTDETYACNA